MSRWLTPLTVIAVMTVAAIAIAATLHPDAPAKIILQDLAVPPMLVQASAESDGAVDNEFWREEQIVRGDTVLSVLARLGVRDDEVKRFLHNDPNARALYRLLPDKSVRVRTDEDGDLLALRYLTREGDLLEIDQDDNGHYRARTIPPPLVTRLQLRSGEIKSSL